ncbi:MAG: DUF3343 domain-containing protein [Eubacteriales bacterium]|nr:DUF3343 domain-containing protein [Eubacteriales bacterium]
MREKEQKYIVTFHTTTGAMKMEKFCKEHDYPGRLIPVPRSISAGCGLCWAAPLSQRERIHEMIFAQGMDVDGEYERLI